MTKPAFQKRCEKIIKDLSPYNVKTNYRPKWMSRLQLDVYIAKLNLAIIIRPNTQYITKANYLRLIQLDFLKKLLCFKREVNLAEINSCDYVSDDYLRHLFSSLLGCNDGISENDTSMCCSKLR